MKHTLLAPSVGESITEVSILKWKKETGNQVKAGELLLEIESDKATVEIVAEASGALTILKNEGERVPVGEPIGTIDDSVQGSATESKPQAQAATAQAPAPAGSAASSQANAMGPAARKMATEQGTDLSQVSGTGKQGRITKGDLLQPTAPAAASAPAAPRTAPAPVAAAPTHKDGAGDRRVPMTNLRARIAERLVQAQHTAAILTTFNEADMGPIMAVRNQKKDEFKAKHGVWQRP